MNNTYFSFHDAVAVEIEESYPISCGGYAMTIRVDAADGSFHEATVFSDKPITVESKQQEAITA
ncbi:hypothetical protein [Thiolapillus sp.]